MILHAASMAALFVDQATQAPVVAQCAQAAPEPWLKWLLPTIVQTVVSLLSIFAGVCIAVRSFRANKETEHEQWIRDQKKAEWSLLLRGVASAYQITDLVIGSNRKIADRIISELEPALKEVSVARANCVFLDKFRLNNECGRKIREFLRVAEIQSQKVRGNLGLFDSIEDRTEKAGSRTDLDTSSQLRCSEVLTHDLSNLAEQSRDLLDWLQNEAKADLVKTSEREDHGAAVWWKKLFNFTTKKTGV
jgi:hypothetical protein